MKEIIQLRGRKDAVREPQFKNAFDKKVLNLRNLTPDDTWKFFRDLGFIDGNRLDARNYDGIHGAWQDEPCFIVGGGPALKEFITEVGFSFLDGKHTIGINHVIEDYDGFEWFFFLDKRFLEKTTYNIDKFKGRIFAQSNTGLKPSDRITVFSCNNEAPQVRIEKGLYSSNLSGLAALNLAILTGANPIYLLGYGNGQKADYTSYHYKTNYTGEVKKQEIFDKFVKVNRYYDNFLQWKKRIVHVTEGSDIPVFNKMKIAAFKNKFNCEKASIEVNQLPKIVHLSFSDKLEVHADITRHIINECYGQHTLVDVNKGVIPRADLYIFEHFQSTNQAISKFPYKNKAVNIVHTVNCIPPQGFKKVISLSRSWQQILKKHFIESEVIYGGIDIDAYKDTWPDYDKKVFGRITRWSPAKIHPEWNGIVKEILDEHQDSKCLMYVDFMNRKNRDVLKHERMVYNESCKIDMFKGDYLKNLSIYVHCNGSFKETLSFAIIEAMATGLPIIYLEEGTGVIEEITGDAGIKCDSISILKNNIIKMLNSKYYREDFGMVAKKRSILYHKNQMVKRFNEVIKSCLK